MMTRILTISLLILTGIEPAASDPPQGPDLGRPLDAVELSRWDFDVSPDGRGLPQGSGTARAGRRIYADKCLSCHGEEGLGDSGDQLAGARMALTDEWPEKTIGTFWPYAPILFDFTRRSMPMEAPGSLSADEAYAVTAYMLFLNGLVSEDQVLDKNTLAKIEMPNRHGFVTGDP